MCKFQQGEIPCQPLSGETPLRSLGEHCFELSKILNFAEELNNIGGKHWLGGYSGTGGSDWLRIAAAIVDVKVDLIQFEQGFGWCSTADEYVYADEQTKSSLVNELTRFMYVWSGLESVIESFRFPRRPNAKDGKVARCRDVLDRYFDENHPVVSHYLPFLDDFAIAGQSSVFADRFSKLPLKWKPGSGLECVYKVRNQFAHGDLIFPTPDSDNKPVRTDAQCVNLATRIVLLSLQMLLIATTPDLTAKYDPSLLCDEEESLPIGLWLYSLHHECHPLESQLRLPLEMPWCFV